MELMEYDPRILEALMADQGRRQSQAQVELFLISMMVTLDDIGRMLFIFISSPQLCSSYHLVAKQFLFFFFFYCATIGRLLSVFMSNPPWLNVFLGLIIQ
jgi:hypothetical protein